MNCDQSLLKEEVPGIVWTFTDSLRKPVCVTWFARAQRSIEEGLHCPVMTSLNLYRWACIDTCCWQESCACECLRGSRWLWCPLSKSRWKSGQCRCCEFQKETSLEDLCALCCLWFHGQWLVLATNRYNYYMPLSRHRVASVCNNTVNAWNCNRHSTQANFVLEQPMRFIPVKMALDPQIPHVPKFRSIWTFSLHSSLRLPISSKNIGHTGLPQADCRLNSMPLLRWPEDCFGPKCFKPRFGWRVLLYFSGFIIIECLWAILRTTPCKCPSWPGLNSRWWASTIVDSVHEETK